MRRSICGMVSLALGAQLALTVSGQGASGQGAAGAASHPIHMWKPYTAEYKETTVGTLADGSTRTSAATEIEAHNSQGQWMHAETSVLPSGEPAPTSWFTMVDAAQNHTTWGIARPGTAAKVVHSATVEHPPTLEAVRSCATPVAVPKPPTTVDQPASEDPAAKLHEDIAEARARMHEANPPGPAMEDLGAKTIRGIEAHGHRFTVMIPAGAYGNTEPFERTFEEWQNTSLGLGSLMVLQVIDEPRGHYVKELVRLTQGEPDQSLFHPPVDYKIVESSWTCAKDSANSSRPKAAHHATPEQ